MNMKNLKLIAQLFVIFFEKISPFAFGTPALFSAPFTVGQVLEEYEPRVDEEDIELTIRDVLRGEYFLKADVVG